MKHHNDSVEILFVAGTNREPKRKRVLIREGIVENCIYPEDLMSIDQKLLGLSGHDWEHIRMFLVPSRNRK